MTSDEQQWMQLKDQYSELARAVGSPSDAWFGDPLESHEAVLERVKALSNERARCVAICEGWIGTWSGKNPQYISAQKWATDAIQDIAEAIESGVPYPPVRDPQ